VVPNQKIAATDPTTTEVATAKQLSAVEGNAIGGVGNRPFRGSSSGCRRPRAPKGTEVRPVLTVSHRRRGLAGNDGRAAQLRPRHRPAPAVEPGLGVPSPFYE